MSTEHASRRRLPKLAAYALPQPHELPAARVDWTLQPRRAALLVHDMQAYFLGAYDVEEPPVATMLPVIAALLRQARAIGMPVFYTAQQGNQDHRDRGLQADFWGPGMRARPEHEQLVEAVAPQPGDIVLTKHRYSAFGRSHLRELLRVRNRDQLLITGLYAHIGCQCTAADAFQHDIQPFMVADALADYSRDWHDRTLAWVAETCGVVMAARDVAACLENAAGDLPV